MTTDPLDDGPLPDVTAAGAGRQAPGSGSTAAPLPEAESRARNESLGEMFASFSENLSTLVRQEIQLAKAEATVEAKKTGTGAGMLIGAVVAAFLVLVFLSLALMWALGSLMHLGWAALIVALAWVVVAVVLGVMGKKYFERIKGLPQTQQTVQELPATLNPGKERP